MAKSGSATWLAEGREEVPRRREHAENALRSVLTPGWAQANRWLIHSDIACVAEDQTVHDTETTCLPIANAGVEDRHALPAHSMTCLDGAWQWIEVGDRLPQRHAGFLGRPVTSQRRMSITGCMDSLLMAPAAGLMHATSAGGKVWDGSASQEDFMKKDECILVDEKDVVTGSGSKYSAHTFSDKQPRGLLHRAFSVFLFNEQNQLLLQQRARSKITFPGVWTNTCCSHQLHGHEPTELDDPEEVSSGSVRGAKRAAVRKLGHELGIPAMQLSLDAFRYLTRLHYCAADTGTYGSGAPWGEHEIDYILFIKAHVDLEPNSDEVEDAKYVTKEELEQLMKPDSGLKWSPWFRIIAERFLHQWWQDVDQTITSTNHVDLERIHRVL